MLRCALVLLLVAAACRGGGGGPQKVGAQPSWRPGAPTLTSAAEPVVFAPDAPGQAMYNKSAKAPKPSKLGDAVVKAVGEVAKELGVEAPRADARLFDVCRELAQVVPEEGVVAYRIVEFTMQRNGLIEPSPHLLVVWGDLGNPDEIVAQLRPRFADMFARRQPVRIGIGSAVREADGSGAVVFALHASSVITNPIPRSLPENGSFRLQAALRAPFRSPDILVTAEDGQTRRVKLGAGKKGFDFSAELSCKGRRGRQQIEINASAETGSTVLANFPIWCGEAPPTSILVDTAKADPPPANAEEAEKRMLALVNRDRRAAGLEELEWDEEVAEVARKHSADMRKTKVVAHISATTGSVADRIRVAKIKTSLVLENVARAYGVAEAHAGLMDSPGHRQNLMSAQANRIGIGIVLGELISGQPEIFVTQVFTRVNRRIDESEEAERLHALLSRRRQIPRAPALERIAQRIAEGLAKGKSRERAWDPVSAEVGALNKTYTKVGSVITAASDVGTLDPAELLSGVVDELGIGIAQGPHPQLGDGATWVVLLLGEARKPQK